MLLVWLIAIKQMLQFDSYDYIGLTVRLFTIKSKWRHTLSKLTQHWNFCLTVYKCNVSYQRYKCWTNREIAFVDNCGQSVDFVLIQILFIWLDLYASSFSFINSMFNFYFYFRRLCIPVTFLGRLCGPAVSNFCPAATPERYCAWRS